MSSVGLTTTLASSQANAISFATSRANAATSTSAQASAAPPEQRPERPTRPAPTPGSTSDAPPSIQSRAPATPSTALSPTPSAAEAFDAQKAFKDQGDRIDQLVQVYEEVRNRINRYIDTVAGGAPKGRAVQSAQLERRETSTNANEDSMNASSSSLSRSLNLSSEFRSAEIRFDSVKSSDRAVLDVVA